MRLRGHAVEIQGEDFGLTASRGSDRNVGRGIDEQLGIELGHVGDPFPVRRPGRRIVGSGIGRDLRQMRALVGAIGGDHEDVGVVVAVWIGAGAFAAEGEDLAVGRPGRVQVIEVAGRDLRQRFAAEVEDVQMGTEPLQVSDLIFLEYVAVHHPGTLRFGFLFLGCLALALFLGSLFGCLQVFRGRILQHQDDALAVRRPGKIFDVLNRLSERLGLSPQAVQQPDVGLALIPLGKECKILSVRAPARMVR